ncbi:MAG: prepilin-type N-terminal cleavage/methylation domain-containing protein [Micavibrio sp.]|nr:prepilin-type N-terminal cleavage/methylation domain-containing protein [Micavibrio sp.]
MRIIKSEKGFTLIEVCIALIIIGLIIGTAAQVYQQRLTWLRANQTTQRIESIQMALANFVELNGRFPCPASLTSRVGEGDSDKFYGREAGACGDNLTYTIAANGIQTLGATQDALLGGVPFKELNLPEEFMTDGYRNRYIYAVSNAMTNQDTFDINNGKLQVISPTGELITNVPFILYSTGEDGAGGYTYEGGAIGGCDELTEQGENCNFASNDPDEQLTFTIAQTSAGNNATKYDDQLLFTTNRDLPKWQVINGTNNANLKNNTPSNLDNQNSGMLGISPGAAEDPSQELDVMGIVRVKDDPVSEEREGKLISDNVCDYSNDNKCFPSDLIGGDYPEMECTTNDDNEPLYMEAISDSEMRCRTIDTLEIVCPGDQIVGGVDENGKLLCRNPPGRCPSEHISICDEIKTIQSGFEGDIREITGGTNTGNLRTEIYKCNGGEWKPQSTSGLCSCEPKEPGRIYTERCNRFRPDICGHQRTGELTRQIVWKCPQGSNTYPVLESTCECDPNSFKDTTVACQEGFTSGERTMRSRMNCTLGKCDPPYEIANSCKCEEREPLPKLVRCPSGFSGKYQMTKTFSCPNGPNEPGDEGDWVEVPGSKARECTCDSSPREQEVECEAGKVGKKVLNFYYECGPNGAVKDMSKEPDVIIDTCEIPKPVRCEWTMQSSTINDTRDFASTTRDGSTCSCTEEKGESKTCSSSAGTSGKHFHGICFCTPQ